jgi:patatin-like phospholipase/acyl hydrolase
MPYKIISLDGGGIRGVFSARILERLEDLMPGLIKNADLIAGTSTGAILAVGLAAGIPPRQAVDLYRINGKAIFQKNLFADVEDLWGIAGARYTTFARLHALMPFFGNVRLAQLPKKVLVPTFDLKSEAGKDDYSQRWKAKFFHNFPGPSSDGDERAIDVIMRSSAAPTFFPIHQGYIDGSVVANNPSMCALAQAINPLCGGQRLDNVVLLSIGTGTKPQNISSMDGNWGLEQWGFKIIDLLFDAGLELADYQCQQLLGYRYYRIDIVLPENIGIDEVGKTNRLIELADQLALQSAVGWLQENWLT